MADEFTIRWNRVSWDRVERDDEIPKDRRLLLIGMRRDGPMDALEVGISDVVVGHWNRHRAAFVPVSVPGPPGPSPSRCYGGPGGSALEQSAQGPTIRTVPPRQRPPKFW